MKFSKLWFRFTPGITGFVFCVLTLFGTGTGTGTGMVLAASMVPPDLSQSAEAPLLDGPGRYSTSTLSKVISTSAPTRNSMSSTAGFSSRITIAQQCLRAGEQCFISLGHNDCCSRICRPFRTDPNAGTCLGNVRRRLDR
jgi:hypothetical protein